MRTDLENSSSNILASVRYHGNAGIVRLCIECVDLYFIMFLWFFLKTFSVLYIWNT
jgi:hypothetical protein